MFEYWTPTGHIFAIVISMMYATYVAKGKIFSKKRNIKFFGKCNFMLFSNGIVGLKHQ